MVLDRDNDKQETRTRDTIPGNATTLKCIMVNKVGQRHFTKKQQKLGSLLGIQTRNGSMEINVEKKP